MFFSYKRHHYDNTPLAWQSNFLFWKAQDHPLFHALMQNLNVFDEYPVENFHSILRAQTQEFDSGELLRQNAKAVDRNKATASNFASFFEIPKQYAFKHDKLKDLKLSRAQFICSVLVKIKDNLGNAEKVPRPKGRQKNVTYWKLPHVYGEDVVGLSKVLPLGFQFSGKEPDPMKFVYINAKLCSWLQNSKHAHGFAFILSQHLSKYLQKVFSPILF